MTQPEKKNWWGRNWKWFVPVGCFGSLLCFAGFVALIVCLVFGAMRSSDVYRHAVSTAKAHTVVQENIGTPINEGFFTSGNIEVNMGGGQANLAIPLSGPAGTATVYVVATKSAGQWKYSTLVVEIDGGKQRIDLLELGDERKTLTEDSGE